MARITVDLDRQLGRVDRRIFGGFIEHLGRCIYGGIFDEGSPLADERGFRTDVLDALRPLQMPLLRWPGGNFVSGYHWLDGVGPRDERPASGGQAWLAEESNRFGTDEFIEYCRVLDTDPYICINMGTGTIDEAQAWVDYATGPAIPIGRICGGSTATRRRSTSATGASGTSCTAAGSSAPARPTTTSRRAASSPR